MVHDKRTFQVSDVASPEELAEQLAEHSWTLCTGFRIGGYLWLNDSFSEDSAQEYTVLQPLNERHVQIESITASWCTKEKLQSYIEDCLKGLWLDRYGKYTLKLEKPAEHHCRLCA